MEIKAHTNLVLFVKRRRADFATDLIVSQQPTLERLSLAGDSLAATGTEYLKLNINVASLEELQLLPGIGRATALKILRYRDSLGGFAAPEDIMCVKGIGEAKYSRLKDYIVTQSSYMK